MKIIENFQINNSLKIDSKSKYYIECFSKNDLIELHKFVKNKNLSVLVIGECTNVILPNFYNGIVVKVCFKDMNFNKDNDTVIVGSSINWHQLVLEAISRNIYGFENLSSIPGSVGAAPIQNIGAYGQEVSNLIKSINCYDYINNKFMSLNNEECDFSYRNSIFKNNSLIIYNVIFNTNIYTEFNLEYDSIKKYANLNDISLTNITINEVSELITNIRSISLPNPEQIPNVGSFFKNAITKKTNIKEEDYSLDELVLWEINSKLVKVGSARLIELIKNQLDKYDNVKLSESHALVLVTNEHASQDEVISFAKHIQDKVFKNFNIKLEIEPTVILN